MQNHKANKPDFRQLKKLCYEAGMKLTQQRLEIFNELLSATDHPSAETIHRRLLERMPTVALDTVYRALTTFEELGLVQRLHIANERTLFDPVIATHHHFICTQ